jgi:hypothetical protein
VLVGSAYNESVPVLRVLSIVGVLWSPSVILLVFLQSRSDRATHIGGLIQMTCNGFQVISVALTGWVAGATWAAAAAAVIQAAALIAFGVAALLVAKTDEATPSLLGPSMAEPKDSPTEPALRNIDTDGGEDIEKI